MWVWAIRRVGDSQRLTTKPGTWEKAQDHATPHSVVQNLLQQMQDKFQTIYDQIIGRIDNMSSHIDDLEKDITDLMTQAGGTGRLKNKM